MYRTKSWLYSPVEQDEPNVEETAPMACPKCGSTEYEIIYRDGKHDYVGCSSCLESIWYDDERLYDED